MLGSQEGSGLEDYPYADNINTLKLSDTGINHAVVSS